MNGISWPDLGYSRIQDTVRAWIPNSFKIRTFLKIGIGMVRFWNGRDYSYSIVIELTIPNTQFWGVFKVITLFQKLWLLLYKRAKLDLRSTNPIKNSKLRTTKSEGLSETVSNCMSLILKYHTSKLYVSLIGKYYSSLLFNELLIISTAVIKKSFLFRVVRR